MGKNEPIRVAHIIGKWIGGGVEAVVMNYYREIDKNKIQFDFICDEDSTNIPYEEIEKMGGKIILIPPYQKVFSYHKILKDTLKKGKYEIVHSHINTMSVFSLYAAKCAGVARRIAHSHSTTNSKEWKKNIIKLLLRPFVKCFANEYMACTEHAARWMFGKKIFEQGKVYILNNAIDIKKFKYNEENRKDIRKLLNISEDTKVIGHIGRFVEQKNHRQLIDIFYEYQKEVENSILVLIGQGPLVNEIKEKVKDLELDSKVMFLGQIEDVSMYYSAMDMFLFPSLYEGLGMVVVEAQYSNVPCIVSNEVPKDVEITDKVHFVDLKEKPKTWKNIMIEMENKVGNNQISTKKFDIEIEAHKLEKKYLKNQKEFLTQEECKKIQLDMLKKIDIICKDNKLNYYLAYGSLLGAVRHNGFIPWDDDIDLYMERKEYEKFIGILEKKINKELSVVSEKNDGYYYPFIKVVDSNTVAKMENNHTEHGIWIDIFPIDKLPNNEKERKKFLKKCLKYRSMIIAMTTDFSNEPKGKKYIVKKILNYVSIFYGKEKIFIRYNNYIRKYENSSSTLYGCLSTPYILREVFNYSELFDKKQYEFEGEKFFGTKYYDSYLSKLYGNYMELPPIENRRVHRIIAWKKNEEDYYEK